MRDEIRRERRVELAAESFRYDDIIRWKTAETELPAAILGAKFDPELYPSTVPGKDVILDKNGFILVQNAESRTFDSSKRLRSALTERFKSSSEIRSSSSKLASAKVSNTSA